MNSYLIVFKDDTKESVNATEYKVERMKGGYIYFMFYDGAELIATYKTEFVKAVRKL